MFQLKENSTLAINLVTLSQTKWPEKVKVSPPILPPLLPLSPGTCFDQHMGQGWGSLFEVLTISIDYT